MLAVSTVWFNSWSRVFMAARLFLPFEQAYHGLA